MSASRSRHRSSAALVAAFVSAVASAQAPQVGDPAPSFALAEWLNVAAGQEPTPDALKGRVVMLEFWGTWCGPCVRAMPEVQRLHDRYGERGLTVLAISFEATNVLRDFLRQNAYSMAVGSDPAKKVVGAYGIRSWPTTFVIGKDGKVAHVGSPYDAEAAVEKALGLETSAGPLLTAWLDARSGEQEGVRAALVRLGEKAPPDFDLRAWARANGGAEPAVAPLDGGAAQPVDAAGGAGRGDAAAIDVAATLRQLASAWQAKDRAACTPLLQRLGRDGPTAFDLAAFARSAFAAAFPFDLKELKLLLEQQKFADVLQAIAERSPAPAVLTAAAKDKKLADYCRKKQEETQQLARKAIMVQRYVFTNALPKDNDGFWKELAVSGIATSPDKKQITGVMLGGANVDRTHVDGFVQSQLAQAILMDSLRAGKAPAIANLAKDVAKERADIERQVAARFGQPKPRQD